MNKIQNSISENINSSSNNISNDEKQKNNKEQNCFKENKNEIIILSIIGIIIIVVIILVVALGSSSKKDDNINAELYVYNSAKLKINSNIQNNSRRFLIEMQIISTDFIKNQNNGLIIIKKGNKKEIKKFPSEWDGKIEIGENNEISLTFINISNYSNIFSKISGISSVNLYEAFYQNELNQNTLDQNEILDNDKKEKFFQKRNQNIVSLNKAFSENSADIITIGNINLEKCKDMEEAFAYSQASKIIFDKKINTSSIKNFKGLFIGCSKLSVLDISMFNTSNSESLSYFFYGCSNLSSLDISNFETKLCNDVSHMFENCSKLRIIKINKENFITKNFKSMAYMFSNCISLDEIDLSGFDTSNCIDFSEMFSNCPLIDKIDLSKFNYIYTKDEKVDKNIINEDKEEIKFISFKRLVDEVSNIINLDLTLNKKFKGEAKVLIYKGWNSKQESSDFHSEYEIKNKESRDNIKINISLSNLGEGGYSAKFIVNNISQTYKFSILNTFNNSIIFAPLVATMPVTLVTLNLKEITNNYTIPFYFILERAFSWNYEYLPKNFYLFHYVPSNYLSRHLGYYEVYYEAFNWFKILREEYPNLHIDFYMTDIHSFPSIYYPILTYMEEKLYRVFLLTDGSATLTTINNNFDNDNYQNIINQNKEKLNSEKENIKKKESFDLNSSIFKSGSLQYTIVEVINKNNFFFWVTDPEMLGIQTKDSNGFYKNIILPLVNSNKIVKKNLGTCFNSLDENGKKTILKLYYFNSNMFEKATNENKKAFIFLGTYTNNENLFDEYAKEAKIHYGTNNYVYYYKGHPRDGHSIEEKKKRFEENEIFWLDSSIAAELIFFFNKENTYYSGYQTSTFKSIDKDHCIAMWNINYDNADVEYRDKLKYYIFGIDDTSEIYGSIAEPKSKNNFVNFLLNYVDEKPTNYDISIYKLTDSTYKHYKNNNGNFELVTQE